MPYINLERKSVKKKRFVSNHNKDIQKVYNDSTWRNLRQVYLMEHPLCEECMRKGIIKPAQEVHHIKEISQGTSLAEMQDIGFDSNNLMALCIPCHKAKHGAYKQIKV